MKAVVERIVPVGGAVTVAVDDTLFHRYGRKVHGARYQHDGSAKGRHGDPGRPGRGGRGVRAALMREWVQGPRYSDWAMTATGIDGQYLLIRRLISGPDQYTFYLCWAPPGRPATMTYFITIAGRRWPVEVGHRCYLSSGICLSRLPSLSFFPRFAGFCLGWCPAALSVPAICLLLRPSPASRVTVSRRAG